jgi:hypothetical protein
MQALPPEKLLPDGQPTYVASWIYVFGVASIASLIVIIASGAILALKGPAWWHYTGVEHFFNSIRLNSVGVGAFFNVANFGQMYSYHVLLLPVAVVALVSAHVLLVRRHGVVPPFEIDSKKAALVSVASLDGSDSSVLGDSPAPQPSTGAQP